MRLRGALSNFGIRQRLKRFGELQERLLIEARSRPKTPRTLKRRCGVVQETVVSVLAAATEPMHVRDVHKAVELALGNGPVSKDSVNSCLSTGARGDTPRFERTQGRLASTATVCPLNQSLEPKSRIRRIQGRVNEVAFAPEHLRRARPASVSLPRRPKAALLALRRSSRCGRSRRRAASCSSASIFTPSPSSNLGACQEGFGANAKRISSGGQMRSGAHFRFCG